MTPGTTFGVGLNQSQKADQKKVGNHTIETIRNRENNRLEHEEWLLADNKLDREDGPALINCDPLTGVMTYEGWFRNGLADRVNGPAELWRDPHTGVVTQEKWMRGGQPDRDKGPAQIWRDGATGKITGEEMWKNGQHAGRSDGKPDSINWDPKTGAVTYESWHNENGDVIGYARPDPKSGKINYAFAHQDDPKNKMVVFDPTLKPSSMASASVRPGLSPLKP
jgi:hypothetical protein